MDQQQLRQLPTKVRTSEIAIKQATQQLLRRLLFEKMGK
jgi:hypothetical protein